MNLIDILDVYALENDSEDMQLLFNDYTLDERIDRNVMNTTILSELGASRPITTDPDLFKMLFDNFFKKYSSNITKLVDTMYYEYNPLHNKNISEEEHRQSEGDIDNTDEYHTDNTTEGKVSAYDSSTYQPKEQAIGDVDHTGETHSDIKSEVDTTRSITGKDGQDSYQSLIEQERKLAEFNIFNWIIKQMRKELFLLIY
ncbi:MAG: hypothetical protein IIW92_08965 [Lachnospiraceae bacterium]|nr:hypothetical protein [Lachnospiraceae bacterium]